MRVLVCGGRDFEDRKLVYKTLLDIHEKFGITQIIHGGARGADRLAGDFAAFMDIPVLCFKAQWDKYGKRAGPIRNQEMANEVPDIVVAFPGGIGTAGMIKIAQDAGLNVMKVEV